MTDQPSEPHEPPEAPAAAEPPKATPAPRSPRTDRSPWHWLLLVPVALPLITVLYNHDQPRLLGFPLFYWLQFAFIALGVATTTLVYQMTKKRSGR